MRSAARDLRRWVRELRSLLVTIAPPALRAQGLGSSLTDLAAGLEGRGVAVSVDVDELGAVDADHRGPALPGGAGGRPQRRPARRRDPAC